LLLLSLLNRWKLPLSLNTKKERFNLQLVIFYKEISFFDVQKEYSSDSVILLCPPKEFWKSLLKTSKIIRDFFFFQWLKTKNFSRFFFWNFSHIWNIRNFFRLKRNGRGKLEDVVFYIQRKSNSSQKTLVVQKERSWWKRFWN